MLNISMLNLNEHDQYGIMLSGGLDSAILLHLLLKENKNIKIQPYTIPKHDGSHLYVSNIIQYFNNLFDIKIPDTILVGDPDVYHAKQSQVAVQEILEKYKIDFLYFATNQNPTHSFDYSKYPADGFPNRVKGSTHPKVLMPFINLYKDDILRILFENKQNQLIDLTHSCTEQKLGRCGNCFQCNERSWAFTQLQQIDTGSN